MRSARVEEGTPRGKLMEEIEVLLFAHVAMVTKSKLFLNLFKFLQHFLRGEGDAINSLEVVVRVFSQPIGCRVLSD